MNTLLSIGHGYSAQALARRLQVKGWHVLGTTRSPAKAAQMAERLVTMAGDSPEPLARAARVVLAAGDATRARAIYERRTDFGFAKNSTFEYVRKEALGHSNEGVGSHYSVAFDDAV